MKVTKILGWTLGVLLILLVALVYSLRFPSVQDYITTKAISYFHDKVDAKASIGRLYVDFPSNITIEDLYLEDQNQDTLVYCHYLTVQTDLWALKDNKLELSDIEIDGLVGKVNRPKTSRVFNYQFIVDAFSSDSTQTSEGSSFDFSIDDVLIQNTSIQYFDDYSGLRFEGDLGQLVAVFDVFDINKPAIGVASVELKDTKSALRLTQGVEKNIAKDEVDTAATNFVLSGNKLSVTRVKFLFEDEISNIKLNNEIGNLQLQIDSLDIENNVYTAKQILIENSFVSFDQYSNAQSDSVESNEEASSIYLLAGAAAVEISNTGFRYYDHNQPSQPGFDPAHIWLQKINTQLSDTYFEPGDISGNIKSLSLAEKGGLAVNQLEGDWSYTDREASFNNLELNTPGTRLKGSIEARYPSIETLADNLEKLWFSVDLTNSIIDLEDLYYFQPTLASDMAFLKPHHRFEITANTKGYLNDFTLEELVFSGFNSTKLKAKGAVKGLPEVNTAFYDLSISEFFTTKADIKNVVPDSLLPENIKLPDTASIKVDFNGTIANFKSQAKIKTSLGSANFNGTMKQEKDSIYSYKGDLKVQKLQLNRLFQNQDLGLVSLSTYVEGRGFALEDINTLVKGNIHRVDYKDYAYKKIDINGTIKNNQFDGHLALDDPNLVFDFNGLVNLNDSIPVYEFTFDLEKADFKALNLTQNELKARAMVRAGLRAKSLESLNGSLTVENFTLAKGESIYQLDTMSLNATSQSSLTDIKFRSTIIDADFNGNFELVTLPQVLQNHFNRYFNTIDSLKEDELKAQDFTFNINFKKPSFFTEFVPGLTQFVPGKMKGKYNSTEWMIDIDVVMNEIAYQGTIVDSLGIKVTSDRTTLSFKTKIAEIVAAGFELNNLELQANVEGDYVKTDFKILDGEGEDRYHFGGKLGISDENYVFQFLPGEFILNYEEWKVKESNKIEILDKGVWVSDFLISQNREKIRVESGKTEKGDTVLNAEFDAFDLSFLGKFKETEAYILGGILNGKLRADLENGGLKADLGIDKFSFKGDTLGNVNLKASNLDNKTDVNLSVSGETNELTAEGTVTQNEETNLDLKATIKRLDVSTIQAYTANELSEMEGTLTGDFRVTGTVANPDINGQLVFNEVGFKVNYLGAAYTINQDEIKFTKTGLSFNKFTVLDDSQNKLTVDGTINSQDYKAYDLNLKLIADNFQMLNTTAKKNDLIYGNLSINSTVDITGNLQNPKVRLNLGVADGSNVTYVIPESEIEIQNRKGIVEFFDKDIEEDAFFKSREIDPQDTLSVWISGMDLRANIDVTKASTFGIVIDPITGDKLTVSGDADLTMTMRPSGDMTLTGRYEVNDGSYDLNFYGIAKRKFDIQPGSSLLWTGDPLNARMNVSASYFVRATPVDADISRKIPFIVYLDLRGELLTPDISFRLALEEEGAAPPSVQTWMANVNQQESVLNKQVFSLLLFKSFISSGSGGGNSSIAQSTARNSVSRILSNQLNRLGSKIQGVELSFDLQSYQDYNESGSTVGRTELELGLSKQFFDNRVIVKVAGNFDLEGKSEQQQNVSDFAGDIKIEYKLTEDGRFRLVGFRQNEYDNLLQGEIAKTGVGVIFVRDYNTLKELFKKSEKEEETNE